MTNVRFVQRQDSRVLESVPTNVVSSKNDAPSNASIFVQPEHVFAVNTTPNPMKLCAWRTQGFAWCHHSAGAIAIGPYVCLEYNRGYRRACGSFADQTINANTCPRLAVVLVWWSIHAHHYKSMIRVHGCLIISKTQCVDSQLSFIWFGRKINIPGGIYITRHMFSILKGRYINLKYRVGGVNWLPTQTTHYVHSIQCRIKHSYTLVRESPQHRNPCYTPACIITVAFLPQPN